MNTNKTNMKELNINEMEQVNGGGKGHKPHQRTDHNDNCGNSSVEAAVKAIGNGACMLGRVACNWFTGLFD